MDSDLHDLRVVPVTTNTEVGYWILVPGILIILVILILIGYFALNSMRSQSQSKTPVRMQVKIINGTDKPVSLSFSDGAQIKLSSGQSTDPLHLLKGDAVSLTNNLSYAVENQSYQFANSGVNTLYVTPDGFRTDLSVSKGVQLQNGAIYPVQFVYVTHEGERYTTEVIPPGTYMISPNVPAKTEWTVIHPSDDQHVLAKIRLSDNAKVSSILFDGKSLTIQ